MPYQGAKKLINATKWGKGLSAVKADLLAGAMADMYIATAEEGNASRMLKGRCRSFPLK